ncbi:MAG TPA: NAD(P)/FAD-dependent oxidoreductase [Nocardioidaceae bacterium]|nr:NAD(P)/FAD-dependent oxidoreductase [Nocardioidaceae bacterium]
MATAPASAPTTAPSTPVDTQVAIIGSGFSGLCMAIQLKLRGINDFVVLEKDDDMGGTWRDNTYPGCACDVPSYLYSFSFEQNPRWSRMFAPQPEIWDYMRHCVNKYGVGPHFRYNASVNGAEFDESTGTWRLQINDNEVLTARSVVAGVGALHKPKVPDLPGLETFAGTTFHSAHWNNEHDLTGRRVAVIGTGASAIQFVPQIAEQVERLDVYQRSAPWITPKPDREIGLRERDTHSRFPLGQRVIRNLLYWAMEVRGVGFAVNPKMMKAIELQARRHLKKQVPDPELRRKLTPDYAIGCKRVLLANDYYPALMRDNVDLVTEGISEVRPDGVVTADGTFREADTIIFGTGFDVAGNLTQMKIVGRGGEELNDVWERKGRGAHLGITVSGFPNLFLLTGPNTGLGHSSMVFMIERQTDYIMQALDLLHSEQAAYLDVREPRQDEFTDWAQNRLAGSVWQGCNSWYVDENGRNFTIWPHFTWKYWLQTRKLRRDEYDVVTAASLPADGTAGAAADRERETQPA